MEKEKWCAICVCKLNDKPGVYGEDTPLGRSHRTKHHYVAERFFGRSENRKHKKRTRIFTEDDPLGIEDKPKYKYFCYDCHEELLHNPVLLPEDIDKFADLVRCRNLTEEAKTKRKTKLGDHIKLLHEVIATGIEKLLEKEKRKRRVSGA